MNECKGILELMSRFSPRKKLHGGTNKCCVMHDLKHRIVRENLPLASKTFYQTGVKPDPKYWEDNEKFRSVGGITV